MDLIHLSDGINSFRVRVLGRRMPGVLPLHDLLDAEVLIESGFGNGRLELTLLPDDLDGWAQGLDMLAAGQDICWIDDNRSPEIRVLALDEEQETPAVRIEDISGSGASMFLPICLEEGWIDDQRRLLQQVRREWPREVQKTSSMAYEWRR
ncbi:hypothetical protein ASC82_00400 [Streptomyces sp. Root431]|uniref:DUF5959 family protein n=1 Tax=Streptomyces sp. Root431 TaxID=1736535 RepID=UPI000702089D|nr:DUF5959 family protein [Streptomyces sp. Root431]KQX16758.1 hypothetical protein ASC82_00400 [Streptomyces sp. Root431]